MAIHKPDSSSDIVNGLAVVLDGSGKTQNYDNRQRSFHVAGTPSGVGNFQTIEGRYLADAWADRSLSPQASADISVPASGNMAAQVVYAAEGSTRHHVIFGVAYGYDSTPTSGVLQVESPSGTVIFGPEPVTAAGTSFVPFEHGLKGAAGQELLVTLSAAGAAVKGRTSIFGHRIE